MHGGGAVFSRDLAMLYRDRARADRLGLARRDDHRSCAVSPEDWFSSPLTKEGVVSICGRPDAPSLYRRAGEPGARYASDPALNATILDAALRARGNAVHGEQRSFGRFDAVRDHRLRAEAMTGPKAARGGSERRAPSPACGQRKVALVVRRGSDEGRVVPGISLSFQP